MNDHEFDQIGSFRVHRTIVSGLTGWEPNYWNVLKFETRNCIKRDAVEAFRSTLISYIQANIKDCRPDYVNHLVLRAASNAMSAF